MEVKTTDGRGVSINDKAERARTSVRARPDNERRGGGENMHHPSLRDTSAHLKLP